MKKAVVFGAGNIGRGFAGQLLSESGYEVVFIDVNMTIIDRLNEDKCYPVYIVSDNNRQEITINNVRGVDGRDIDAVAREVAEAEIMATSVGMQALKIVAKSIAYGLNYRWKMDNTKPINIILFENMMDADKFMKEQIASNLDSTQLTLMDEKVGIVEASIGRMVPVVTPEMQEGNPLQIYVEAYSQLPVDKNGFKGEIPYVKNMVPYSPFDFYIQRKLFMHNMGHAVSAYLGYIKNYDYIWQAIQDPIIKKITGKAFDESAGAMSKEHNVSLDILLEHKDDLISRFGNKALGDKVDRVGKDPIRKLSINDRLAGAANLCEKHGILPVNICLGIAAAFMYNLDGDDSALEVQSFLSENGIEAAVSHFCSFEADSKSYNLIIDYYNKLSKGEAIDNLI